MKASYYIKKVQRVMVKGVLPFYLFTFLPFSAHAEDYTYNILSEKDTTITVTANGMKLGSRDIHRILYEYPSKDADGKTVTISGGIWVPSNIYEGKAPCDGVILYNHYAHTKAAEQPSVYGEEACNGILSSPLKPNYILVISDYIGFGSSVDRPQAFLCGDINARNSLDGLLAGRQLMNDKSIPQGKYLFNMGFSQGGTETMFVAKLRDMEYKDKGITFDKTFAGGGPLDFDKAYTEMLAAQQNAFPTGMVLMIACLNENYHLGLDYKEIFQEPLASHMNEWILSKQYNTDTIRAKIGSDSLKHYLQPDYLNINSDAVSKLRKKLQDISMTNGWELDPTQHYFIEHSRHDNYIGIQSVRSVIPWMTGKGMKPSIVPGKTGLQTNTVVFKVDHKISGIIWFIQTAVALQVWPVLYYEGEQNCYYNDVVKDLNLLKAIKLLESMGIDLRKLIKGDKNESINENGVLDVLNGLSNKLESLGLSISALFEMFEDSGITLFDLIDAYNYLMKDPAGARGVDAVGNMEAPLYLIRQYEQALAAWFLTAGLDVQYNTWGWGQLDNEK